MRTHLIALPILVAIGCVACATDDGTLQSQPQSGEAQATSASDENREVEISTHKYSARMRAGDGLAFANQHGDLRIRMAGDSGVHFAAVIQKLDGEQRDVEFSTDRQPGGLAFSVNPPDGWVGRVDSSARIPEDCALELNTTDGLLEVRTAANPVNAQSTSGEIRYRGTGTIHALSQHGNIEIAMHGQHYDAEAGSIMTGGDITLWLMPGADLVVQSQAGGEIVNEFPQDIGKAVMSDGKLRLELGAGSSELVVQAGGDIVIHVLPTP